MQILRTHLTTQRQMAGSQGYSSFRSVCNLDLEKGMFVKVVTLGQKCAGRFSVRSCHTSIHFCRVRITCTSRTDQFVAVCSETWLELQVVHEGINTGKSSVRLIINKAHPSVSLSLWTQFGFKHHYLPIVDSDHTLKMVANWPLALWHCHRSKKILSICKNCTFGNMLWYGCWCLDQFICETFVDTRLKLKGHNSAVNCTASLRTRTYPRWIGNNIRNTSMFLFLRKHHSKEKGLHDRAMPQDLHIKNIHTSKIWQLPLTQTYRTALSRDLDRDITVRSRAIANYAVKQSRIADTDLTRIHLNTLSTPNNSSIFRCAITRRHIRCCKRRWNFNEGKAEADML